MNIVDLGELDVVLGEGVRAQPRVTNEKPVFKLNFMLDHSHVPSILNFPENGKYVATFDI